MAAPVLFHHRSSLDHDPGPHPEQPARIIAIERALAERDWLGFERRESPAATRDLLEAVHSPRLIDGIEALSASGGGAIDADTVVSEGSWVAALHAAGGAAAMVDAGRWGSACSTTSRSRRAARATSTASRAC
jgi:acetoin utilization deacetylase AcuC-like enzyme